MSAGPRRTISRTLVLAIVFAGAAPLSSFAQERRLEISGFIGGLSITHDLGSVDNIYFTTTGAAENISFGKYLGIRGALYLSPFIGIEANLSRGTNSYSYSVDDRDLGTVDLGGQFEAKQLNYGGAVVAQYPLENGFTPYGTVGLGRQTSDPTSPIAGVESVSGFDFTVGGGIKYFFNGLDMPWLGFRFDLRYHFLTNGLAFEGNEVSPRQSELSFGGVLRPF
jgi:opacity protein-like surface antigen